LAEIDSGGINPADVVSSIIAISHVAENAMGGTSGALYSYVNCNQLDHDTTLNHGTSAYFSQVSLKAFKVFSRTEG